VAPAFQEVIMAQEQKLTTILNAEKEAITTRTLIAGAAAKRKNDATADAYYKAKVAEAVVAKFKDQRTAYELAPSIYKLRSTLDVITESLGNKTIYLVQTKAKLVYELDFKEQIRPGLMDYDQYNPENKK
jgi:regulator of protease activity HflC (stomatin/prohibitin superfamily)